MKTLPFDLRGCAHRALRRRRHYVGVYLAEACQQLADGDAARVC
jgi:hypothetical protein